MKNRMKKTYCIFLLIFLHISSIAQSPNWLWVKTMNCTANAFPQGGKSIAIDNSENVYIIGSFEGTLDFDPGPGTSNITSAGSVDAFISKYDNLGNFVWTKTIGGAIADQALSLTLDSDGNVIVTGIFKGTVDFDSSAVTFNLSTSGATNSFILKLDPLGNFIWAKQFESSFSSRITSKAITIDGLGNIYLSGDFTGTADFDPSDAIFSLTTSTATDVFISKLDSQGNFVWVKAFTGSNDDSSNSIALDSNGNVYIVGSFAGNVDFDPSTETYNLTSRGGSDIFIVKMDHLGNLLWAKQIGSTRMDWAQCITITSDDYIYTTGIYAGMADFDPNSGIFNQTPEGINDVFISKLDNTGNFIFAKSLGGIGYPAALSIANDTAGNIYLGGNYLGVCNFNPDGGNNTLTSAGDYDIFVSKLNNSGNLLWTKSAGGISEDNGCSLLVDSINQLYLTGNTKSLITNFDTITSSNTSGNSLYIAKLAADQLGTISHEIKNGLTIFPNPFSDHCTINFEVPQVNTKIKIFNILGQEIKHINFNGKQLLLEKENIEAGVYLFQAIDNENNFRLKKIIIK